MQANDWVQALQPLDLALLINNGVQAAIGLTFTIALLGAALTLRRPAMWSLGLCWGLFSTISVLLGVIVVVHAVPNWPTWQTDVPLVLLTGIFGAVYPATRHAVRTIADAHAPPLPSARSLLAFGGLAAALHAAAIELATRGYLGLGDPSLVLLPRAIGILAVAGGGYHAWRASRQWPSVRPELVLLVFGFGLMALRAPINAFVAYSTGNGPMFDGLSVLVFANIVSCMLVGAASLTAAMSQERTSYRAQAETLQRSEARLARGVRLESMGRMAAGIAHDFNNVLTVIDSSVMLAGDSADPSEARSYLTEARAASARGIGLTRQLLAFAREQPRASERLELAARIESLRPMLGRLAGPAVDIRVGAIPQDAAIRLEPSQFDQILLNLVANARDAMPNGGVVTIDATTRDVAVDTVDSRRFVHLRFSDNGEGMDAATIEHIFEPFFSTKSDGKGSGLGLATVYGIVRQAHGEITVRSTVGGGAHFEIQLPAA